MHARRTVPGSTRTEAAMTLISSAAFAPTAVGLALYLRGGARERSAR